MQKYLQNSFYIDRRSYVVGRYVLALAAIGYIIQILIDRDLIFGMYSFHLPMNIEDVPMHARLFFYFSTYYQRLLLLVMTVICSICFGFGYKTRFFSFVLAILFFSIIFWIRPWINSGHKMLAFVFLILSIVPIDRTNNKLRNYSFSNVVLFIQVGLIFLNSVVFKLRNDWWINGEAVFQAYELDAYTSFMAQLVRGAPLILFQIGDYITLFVELVCPILLLLGFLNDKIRLFAVFSMSILLVGFILFINIGFFPIVFLGTLLIIYPSSFWDLIIKSKYLTHEIEVLKSPRRSILASILLSLIIFANFKSAFSEFLEIPKDIENLVDQKLGFIQHWGVYCQNRWRTYSISISAKTAKGYPGDLYRWWTEGVKEDPAWIFYPSPYYVRNKFSTAIWRDFFYYFYNEKLDQRFIAFAKSLCRKYNDSHQEKMVEVSLLRAQRETLGYDNFRFSPAVNVATAKCEL